MQNCNAVCGSGTLPQSLLDQGRTANYKVMVRFRSGAIALVSLARSTRQAISLAEQFRDQVIAQRVTMGRIKRQRQDRHRRDLSGDLGRNGNRGSLGALRPAAGWLLPRLPQHGPGSKRAGAVEAEVGDGNPLRALGRKDAEGRLASQARESGAFGADYQLDRHAAVG